MKDKPPPPAAGRHSPHQNHLLDALPTGDYERIAPHLELIPMRLGDVLYESGDRLRYVYFPTTSIVSLLYVHGGWRVRRDRGRGQRGHPRHFPVHGRRNHAQPRRRAERRTRLPAQGRVAQGRVRALRSDDAPAAALHPGADHPDGADGGLQSASFGRPAIVPVAAAEPRSPAIERARDDAGADRQHARRAPRRRHRGRREVAGRRVDSLPSRQDHRARSPGSGGAILRVLPGGQDGVRSSPALRRPGNSPRLVPLARWLAAPSRYVR